MTLLSEPASSDDADSSTPPPQAWPFQPPHAEAIGSSAWWDRDIFIGPDGGCCPDAIDLTGRARCVVFGPYIGLPQGPRRATVYFDLCPDAAHCRLQVQFGAEPHYTTVDVPFGVAGQHRIEVVNEFTAGGAGQIRILVAKAAFHGELRFLGATVETIDNADCFTIDGSAE